MNRFRKKSYYIKLDFYRTYNLIHMKEEEEWKTAFQTKYGHYKYIVMPFKLTNALAII